MRVFHPHGSKERLLEMVQKVSGIHLNEGLNVSGVHLNEGLLPQEKKIELINKFVTYAVEKLKIKSAPEIVISNDEKEAETMKSFGGFNPESKKIRVVIANRNLADALRTLAHELVHYMQFLNGKIKPESGETGSDEENEANSLAGVLMREFGRANSIIFE